VITSFRQLLLHRYVEQGNRFGSLPEIGQAGSEGQTVGSATQERAVAPEAARLAGYKSYDRNLQISGGVKSGVKTRCEINDQP
jgi:hypothetical protein